jgi:hypothetical protein
LRVGWAAVASLIVFPACSLIANYAGVFGGTQEDAGSDAQSANTDAGTDADCPRPTVAGSDNVCHAVHFFTGTQTVDAINEEFCGLPETIVTAVDGGSPSISPPPGFVDAVAGVWVGWSDAGLHLFVHVSESPVTPPDLEAGLPIYYGDAVELFVAGPYAKLTGDYLHTGTDVGPLHLIVGAPPPDGGASAFFGANAPGAENPQVGQYASRQVPGGYDVEALLPWGLIDPTSEAPQLYQKIAFDIGIDQRAGSLVGFSSFYFYSSHTGVADCQGPVADKPSCDDRTWCSTQLQQ